VQINFGDVGSLMYASIANLVRRLRFAAKAWQDLGSTASGPMAEYKKTLAAQEAALAALNDAFNFSLTSIATPEEIALIEAENRQRSQKAAASRQPGNKKPAQEATPAPKTNAVTAPAIATPTNATAKAPAQPVAAMMSPPKGKKAPRQPQQQQHRDSREQSAAGASTSSNAELQTPQTPVVAVAAAPVNSEKPTSVAGKHASRGKESKVSSASTAVRPTQNGSEDPTAADVLDSSSDGATAAGNAKRQERAFWRVRPRMRGDASQPTAPSDGDSAGGGQAASDGRVRGPRAPTSAVPPSAPSDLDHRAVGVLEASLTGGGAPTPQSTQRKKQKKPRSQPSDPNAPTALSETKSVGCIGLNNMDSSL
jgi:hypothetical protein